MRRRHIFLALALLIFVSGAVFFIWSTKSTESEKDMSRASVQGIAIESPSVGLEVVRDEALSEMKLSEEDKKTGKLWEYRQPSNSEQVFVISSSYEQGAPIKKLTALTKKSIKEAVTDNVERQIRQYPQFKEIDKKDITVNGIEATELKFTYVSQSIEVKQHLILFFKNSDTVVYIRGQAKSAEYEEINSKYFQPLLNSVKFN